MGDLNESGINDPAMPNAQNEGAFNNPHLDAHYRSSMGRNFSAAKGAQILRAVRECLNGTVPCRRCEGSGRHQGQMCEGCRGDGRVAPESAALE